MPGCGITIRSTGVGGRVGFRPFQRWCLCAILKRRVVHGAFAPNRYAEADNVAQKRPFFSEKHSLDRTMMQDDLSTLFQRIRALPDRELVSLLGQEADQYTPEAISVAEVEAETRGGLLHLKQETALARPEQEPPKRLEQGKHLLEDLFSKLIGKPPSEQYPGLSYIAIALRLISFILAALAVTSSVVSFYYLLAGIAEWWWVMLVGLLQPAIAFLLFYGGSELINVVLDIEKNTREGRHAQHPKPPAESA